MPGPRMGGSARNRGQDESFRVRGTRPERDRWIAQVGVQASRAAQRASKAHRRAPPSVEETILYVLRSHGGRLPVDDLEFEMRHHGAHPIRVNAALGELVARRLVRGPLWESLVYELTAVGWDVCAASIGRA